MGALWQQTYHQTQPSHLVVINFWFHIWFKSLLRQSLSEPEFYGDLVCLLKNIVGSNNFSAQLIKLISNYKKIGYNINVLE